MEKPITVIEREYQEKLVAITNEAALPTFMKKAVVKELYNALADLDMRDRAKAEEEWAQESARLEKGLKALSEENNENDRP